VSSSIVKPIAGNESPQEKSTLVTPRGESSSYCTCTFCKRVGHTITTCFKKNTQSTFRCILTERREIMPTATFVMCSLKHSFKYMVNSGADRSIIHHRVAKITNTHFTPVSQTLTGEKVRFELLDAVSYMFLSKKRHWRSISWWYPTIPSQMLMP
jgi:hypothetical protein